MSVSDKCPNCGNMLTTAGCTCTGWQWTDYGEGWQWAPDPYKYTPGPIETNTSVYRTDPSVDDKLDKIIKLLEQLVESKDKRQED